MDNGNSQKQMEAAGDAFASCVLRKRIKRREEIE